MENATIQSVKQVIISKPNSTFDWHKSCIDHPELMAKQLPAQEFLIKGLQPRPSLSILAAVKKIGKSWLEIQKGVCVSSGTPFLGMETRQGPVVYLALEDGERRIQQRLRMQGASTNLPITYVTKFLPLNTAAGLKAFEDLIDEKKPVLVIIDTLSSALTGKLDQNSSGETGEFFNRLHSLAMDKNICIEVVSHHGKNKPTKRDAGMDIRGSSAIPGASDVNVGLYRNDDQTFDLKIEGRDIPESEVRLKFDKELTWAWQVVGNTTDVRRSEAEEKIMDAIRSLGGEAEASVIAMALNLTRATIQTSLKRMREEGLLAFKLVPSGRNKKILYTISPTSPTIPTPSCPQHQLQRPDAVVDVGSFRKRNNEATHSYGVDDVCNVGEIPTSPEGDIP